MNKATILRSLFLVSSGLAFSATAAATPTTQPGAMCVSISATPVTYNIDAEATNANADALNLVCPIVRDVGAVVAGVPIIGLSLMDRHPSENICCSSRSRRPNGSLLVSSTLCTSGSGSAQTLTFVQPVDSNTDAARFLECGVPGVSSSQASAVRSYRVAEL